MRRNARAGAATLALVFGAVLSCRRTPAPSLAAPSASATARWAPASLKIQEPHHDFSAVVQGSSASYTFALTNAGLARLELEASTEALGCVGELEPKALEPGASGQLSVTCRPQYYGPLHVTLPVRRAESGETVAQVELTANVTPLLAFDTPLVAVEMPFGEERSVDVHVQGALADRAKLTLESAGDVGFSVAPLTRTGAAPTGFRLQAKGRKVGVHVGNVVFKTNLERPRQLSLPYSCEVSGSLTVTPSTPYFDLKVPGAAVREIAVSSSQSDFEVHTVRVIDGPFSASFARTATTNAYTVTVAVQLERVPKEARGSLGRLLILSNDRAEPEKELPLFAFGSADQAVTD